MKLLSRQEELNAAIFVQQAGRPRSHTLKLSPNHPTTPLFTNTIPYFLN